jgi:drug/metabolite transporter (DMT)-like permease
MSKPTLALLVGGLLPAVLFGIASNFQKTAARAGIGTGPYLMSIGAVVLLVGTVVTCVQSNSPATREGAAWACGYGVLWSTAVGCIVLALSRYDANISQLVPLYNLNTLVAVAIGLGVLGEWREVIPWRVVAGAGLAVAGAVLVATAAR